MRIKTWKSAISRWFRRRELAFLARTKDAPLLGMFFMGWLYLPCFIILAFISLLAFSLLQVVPTWLAFPLGLIGSVGIFVLMVPAFFHFYMPHYFIAAAALFGNVGPLDRRAERLRARLDNVTHQRPTDSGAA